MKLSEFNALVTEMIQEMLEATILHEIASRNLKVLDDAKPGEIQEAKAPGDQPSQHKLYRKSKLHPHERAKTQAAKGIKNAVPELTRILIKIEDYPAVETTNVDPRTKKSVTTRYENQRLVAIGAAQRILHGMNVARADVNTLGKFLVDIHALPGVPLPVILRGLATIFVQNSG